MRIKRFTHWGCALALALGAMAGTVRTVSAQEGGLSPIWNLEANPGYEPAMSGPLQCSTDLKDPNFYVGVEYLLWWISGENSPPILTTGPVNVTGPSGIPGVVGAPGTQILAGGNIGFGASSGARVSLGGWLCDDRSLGFEVTYLFLGQQTNSRTYTNSGLPGAQPLTIPFNNAQLGGVPDSTGVALPGSSSGTASLGTAIDLQSFEANLPMRLSTGSVWRIDGMTGFRWVILDEYTSLYTYSKLTYDPLYMTTTDRFSTTNNFYGGQLGLKATGQFDRWTVQGYTKVALGATASDIKISGTGLGNVFSSSPGMPLGYPGGYLAQPSNEGNYRDANFAVLPEVGFNVGYDVTARLNLFMGFSGFYLSQAARSAEQISPLINPSQAAVFNGPTTYTGPAAPLPTWDIGNFWAYGLNFGGQFKW
ncbi:MAG: BBP7 family outer membrane beta-barrel protein [Gemmataceae bacterium]